MLTELIKVLEKLKNGLRKAHREQRHRTPAEMKQTPAKSAARFCRRKLCARKLGSFFVTGTTDSAKKAEPLLRSAVPARCLSPDTCASLTVATLSRESSLCPGSTPAAINTWVTRARFPRKPIERG